MTGDALRWTPSRRSVLVELLSTDFANPASIEELVDHAAISRQLLPTGDTIGDRWRNLIEALLRRQQLDALPEAAFAKSKTLQARLAKADAALAPRSSGNPVDAYQVRLLGFGKKPLINRRALRTNFKQFIDERAPVLVVRGPARSGKSFSYELMKHVARSLGRDIAIFDFSVAAEGNTAVELIAMISQRLALGFEEVGPRHTTAERQTAELVNRFVGAYRSKPPREPRILVIDGLNRGDLMPDVQSVVVRLALEVVRGELPDTQLVLTGYHGTFDSDVVDSLIVEDIAPITEADVRLFFDGLECREPLSAADLDTLVGRAMAGNDVLDELSRRVQELVKDLVGQP